MFPLTFRLAQAALLAILLGGAALAEDLDTTAGMRNGRYWRNLSRALKVAHLVGFVEGLQAVSFYGAILSGGEQTSTEDAATTVYGTFFPAQATFGEIAEMIDAFYKDTANARVPIVGAVHIAKMTADGGSQKAIDEVTRAYRKISALFTTNPEKHRF